VPVFKVLRRYWADAIFGLVAGAILASGAYWSITGLIGAGSALTGAALMRIVDLAREHRGARQRDLDETRRIAYMALLARKTSRHELAATIVNALAHHGMAVDPEEAEENIRRIVSDGPGDVAESEDWLRKIIAQITEQTS
jgi:hypothetical protein